MFEGEVFLITGGAGSIGSYLTKKLLDYKPHAIRVLDNNEHALFQLMQQFKDKKSILRPLLGDIRDRPRMEMALQGVDNIIHTAAIKNIAISEFNVPETLRINVEGTINLIETSYLTNPKRFLLISTDKAVDYTSLYGASKFCAESLIKWAHRHSDTTKYAICRFGNVKESRGNVFEIWQNHKASGLPLPVTDKRMRRYLMLTDEAVNHILYALENMKGGEIFVPKMREYRIIDLAKKYGGEIKIIGIRKGERLREKLLSREEKKNAQEHPTHWIIKNA